MDKKNRAKKKKLNYSLDKFVKNICVDQCGLCTPGGPEFCFEMYRLNPKKFIKFGINSILEGEDFVSSITTNNGKELKDCSDEEIQYVFEEFFCGSRLCGRSGKGFCNELPGCLSAFRRQIRGEGKVNVILNVSRKKKDRSQSKYHTQPVKNPTPTFFCNEKFEKEVRTILYGDSSGEQDSIKERTGTDNSAVSRAASSSQS